MKPVLRFRPRNELKRDATYFQGLDPGPRVHLMKETLGRNVHCAKTMSVGTPEYP
jgi:hypothetical protein